MEQNCVKYLGELSRQRQVQIFQPTYEETEFQKEKGNANHKAAQSGGKTGICMHLITIYHPLFLVVP